MEYGTIQTEWTKSYITVRRRTLFFTWSIDKYHHILRFSYPTKWENYNYKQLAQFNLTWLLCSLFFLCHVNHSQTNDRFSFQQSLWIDAVLYPIKSIKENKRSSHWVNDKRWLPCRRRWRRCSISRISNTRWRLSWIPGAIVGFERCLPSSLVEAKTVSSSSLFRKWKTRGNEINSRHTMRNKAKLKP